MLQKITFKQYKAFAEEETLELRPITLLVGKNSSGKSSICKLLSMVACSLSANFSELLPLRCGDIVLGGRYEDLFYGHQNFGLEFRLEFEDEISLEVHYIILESKLYVTYYRASNGSTSAEAVYRTPEESRISVTHGFINESLCRQAGIDISRLKTSVDYIGPIREQIDRSFTYEGDNSLRSVGFKGSNTCNLLLNSHLNNDELFASVSKWMDNYMEGQKLSIKRNGEDNGNYSLYVDRGSTKVNIADVGQGLVQLLPVVTQTFLGRDSIGIVEQPALHLHPAIHQNVAHRFADAVVADPGKRFLLESHSLNFLLELRRLVADRNYPLSTKDVVVYFVDYDEEEKSSHLNKIEILDNGDLTDWPEGVFNESFELLAEIVNQQA